MTRLLIIIFILSHALIPRAAFAESQTNDYKGISDPFGDPNNYEFSEDEREDKEFFHLGRYLMFGIDFGVGIYTMGLGSTTDPGFNFGGRMLYFFDRSLALEIGIHYAEHFDIIRPASGGQAKIISKITPINLGFRYYFDNRDAPKALVISNPYLSGATGLYMRSLKLFENAGVSNLRLDESGASSLGFAIGGGIEFPVYHRNVFFGLDARYHLVFFNDEDDDFGGLLGSGSRAGDYITFLGTFTYNF